MADYTNDGLFNAILRQAVIKNNNNEIASIPPEDELKRMLTFSDSHNKRMKKLFIADKRREFFTIFYKWSKVAVVAVCISSTLMFSILLTSAEVRKAISNVIVTWFDQFTKFQSEEVGSEFVERDWSLDYLPIGFYLNEEFTGTDSKYFEYVHESGSIIDFGYIISDDSVSVDNENKKYKVIIENDIVYHLFESTLIDNEHDFNTIIWDMFGYRFTIAGNYDINELLKIALSVV